MIKRFLASVVLTLGLATTALADITTGKFGTAQLFDVQWNVSGGNLNTSSYNYLYRSVPSASRMNASDYSAIDSTGQYFAFFDSTTNPGTYGMALYNSDGTVDEVIHNTGSFRVLADGAIFYLGNGSWGTLITTAEGFAIGSGSTFTVEEDRPSNSTMGTWVPDSTEVLAVGETAGSGAPTVVSTTAGTPIVTTSTNTGTTIKTSAVTNGTTVQVVTTAHAVSENATTQTVDTTVTTVDTTPITTVVTNTTPVTTTTCTTPTTVTTYSDSSTTTANGSQTCTDSTANTVTTTSSTVDDVQTNVTTAQTTGRIDQLATAQDITSGIVRGLEFNGAQAVRYSHDYKNGMKGNTNGFSIGGKKAGENGVIVGGGLARFSTSIDDADSNTAGANTTVLDANIGKEVVNGTVTFGVRHGMTDYSISRSIGDWTNTGDTEGTDTSARIMFEGNGEKVRPVIGYTRGKRSTDAYIESGDALTARNIAESDEMYGYGTIGGTIDFGTVYVVAMHHTDGVNQASVGIEKETDKVTFGVKVDKTMTDLGNTTSLSAGISWKF